MVFGVLATPATVIFCDELIKLKKLIVIQLPRNVTIEKK